MTRPVIRGYIDPNQRHRTDVFVRETEAYLAYLDREYGELFDAVEKLKNPEPFEYKMSCQMCYLDCTAKFLAGESLTQLLEGIGKEGVKAVRKTGVKGVTKIIGNKAFTIASGISTFFSLKNYYDCINVYCKCCDE